MITYSGMRIDYLKPTPDMFKLEDIAVALSRIARFNGHTDRFITPYSVAEHSIHVSKLVPQRLAAAALMHDAAEAYLGDVISPLKKLLPGYVALYKRTEEAIAQKWDLDLGHPEIKIADEKALNTELRDLFSTPRCCYDHPICALRINTVLSNHEAKSAFLERAAKLGIH